MQVAFKERFLLFRRFIFGLCCVLFALNAFATTRYVDLNSLNPTPPYSDWPSAATNIQDAIDVASDGDQIWVTNGIYAVGGKVTDSTQTNRVVLDKALTVQSVNGPLATVIQGAGATNGPSAVRCAWLTNGASLIGFTLRAGAISSLSGNVAVQSGGGACCASSNAVLANCIITGNTALTYGGGVYQGTLNSCLISSNNSFAGGSGAADAFLNNCTVIGNLQGGVRQSIPDAFPATNCIIFFNANGNFVGGGFSHCCTTPAVSGDGNFTNSPLLFVDGVRLTSLSPCIGAGAPPVTGTDLFGKPWANPPAVGCVEYDPTPLVTVPKIQLTKEPPGFKIGGSAVTGQPPLTFQWLHNGAPLADDLHFSSTQTTNLVATGINYSDAGSYQLVISNASGVTTSAVAQLVVHCVDAAGLNPVAPYSNWATAATNIQDAISAAATGEVVLVTNGLYATGSKSMDRTSTNRVAVDKPILIQSINGPEVTVIQGAWDPTSTNGPGAIRCVWLTNNATLSGFTLCGGATPASTGDGGGVWASSTNAVVWHCYLLTNYASDWGGGAYGATLNRCLLVGNHAGSGGGAAFCTLKDCWLSCNFAEQGGGGGAYVCTLRGCALTMNSSYMNGGAAQNGLLVNCTASRNTSSGYTSGYGSAVCGAVVSNSIVWGNYQRTSNPDTNYANCTISQSCTDPIAPGAGNFAADPQLLADGFHLAETSPCIAVLTNGVALDVDIDGQPWNVPASVGCDEWHSEPVIGSQPTVIINSPAGGFTVGIIAAGKSPLTCYWTHNGAPITDDPHYRNSSTAQLVVQNFGPDDAGTYQVVVSNSFGLATSELAQVTIHVVDAASTNPVAPYLSWSTAAATIQDAIDSASTGDIVLVTNGVYATGGKAPGGSLTNRVVLDKPLTVLSVNGYSSTIIEGAWDPATTNGPAAVRCAWLTNGAVLSGFTLRQGATLARTGWFGGAFESGGGAWCVSTNAIVANCVFTNNCAVYGGAFAQGTVVNSYLVQNVADYGGATFNATLGNCTVLWNYTSKRYTGYAAGTYGGSARSSIVLYNYDGFPYGYQEDNFGSPFAPRPQYSYCCTQPMTSGPGNLTTNPLFIDGFHLASSSPCRSAGSALYAWGNDLDGEAWQTPPSIGCDEVVVSNLVGPLSIAISPPLSTYLLVNRAAGFDAAITGRASVVNWDFGDGASLTNLGDSSLHVWTNFGDYVLTATVFNADHPEGVSAKLPLHVAALASPQINSQLWQSNNFAFQFAAQPLVFYEIQYATNLSPPISWQTIQRFYGTQQLYQITNAVGTGSAGFYRVHAQ
ncbi:MAG TPA: immunoglobulin domain-containing protein [Verrucomicrobiae bacterium]|nr:immunoglobulin domain-containing protein [Verrucomicrobiae bacterium]